VQQPLGGAARDHASDVVARVRGADDDQRGAVRLRELVQRPRRRYVRKGDGPDAHGVDAVGAAMRRCSAAPSSPSWRTDASSTSASAAAASA
jgi:hypothetical protein